MKTTRRPKGKAAIERIADIIESHLAKFSPEERERHLKAFHEAALKAGASRPRKAQANPETGAFLPSHHGRELHR
jgi:hypothetical protein